MLAPGNTNIWTILVVCPGRVMHPLVSSNHGYIQKQKLLIINL